MHDDISLNTTNYPIFNMQDFRIGLWFSMLDLFWPGGIPNYAWSGGIRPLLLMLDVLV